MKEQKFLIIGGKGKTGRRVVNRLTKFGYNNIRIGSRSEVPPLIGRTRKPGARQLKVWMLFTSRFSPI